jgi:AAA+ ATPase superfamily predicted ATPase
VDAFFQREPDFLLREELAEVRQAASVLEATARGRHSQGEIARSIGLSTAALAPHLKNLVGLGYLERVFPLIPGRPPRTSVLYRVADPLLRFWFRFVEPHWSTLRRFSPERAFEQIVAPQWDAYCGESFERLCREALPLLYAAEKVTGPAEIGEFWERNVQIDVVGLRDDDWIDLGECKWHGRPAVTSVLRELADRAALYPAKGRTLQPRVFLRAAPKSIPDGTRVHDLRSLYEES